MAEYRIEAHDSREWRQVYVVRPMLVWSPLVIALYLSAWLTTSQWASGLALGIALAVTYHWLRIWIRWQKTYADHAALFRRPVRVTISASSITVEHEHGARRIALSAIAGVLRLPGTIVIHLRGGSGQTLLLPRRHLSNEEQATIRAWPVTSRAWPVQQAD